MKRTKTQNYGVVVRLKRYMKKEKVSYTEVADYFNVSVTTIKNWLQFYHISEREYDIRVIEDYLHIRGY